MLPESLTIGIIQFRTIPGQVERNLESTSALIESAKRSGAEVVVLPEMWPTGYGDIDYRSLSEPIPGRYTEYLMRHAIRHRINLVAGMPERANGNELYNTSIFISDEGKIVAKHRKIHLYTPMGEDKIWRSGNSYTVADTKIGRIGLLTCYDGDFPESWRATSLMGLK